MIIVISRIRKLIISAQEKAAVISACECRFPARLIISYPISNIYFKIHTQHIIWIYLFKKIKWPTNHSIYLETPEFNSSPLQSYDVGYIEKYYMYTYIITYSVFNTDHRLHQFVFPYASLSQCQWTSIRKSVLVQYVICYVILCVLWVLKVLILLWVKVFYLIQELYKEKKTGIHGQFEIIWSGHRIIFCFVSPERSCQCAVTSGPARSII